MLSLSGTRLKSLTSNGTQWIETNIYANGSFPISCLCSVPNLNDKINWIFGCEEGGNSFSFGKSESNCFFAKWGEYSVTFDQQYNTEDQVAVSLGRVWSSDPASAVISNEKIYKYTTIFDPYEEENYEYSFSMNSPLLLFANSIDWSIECGTVTIYEIRSEGEETTYFDLVPWMDGFGRVGMKDLISNQFFPGQGEAFEIEYFEEPGFLAEKGFWLNKLYTHRGIKNIQQRRNYNQLQKEFISFDVNIITKAPDFECEAVSMGGTEYSLGVWRISDSTLPFMKVVNSKLGTIELDEWYSPSILYHDDSIVAADYCYLYLIYVYNPDMVFDLRLAADLGLSGEIAFPQKGLYYIGTQLEEIPENFQLSIYYKNGTSKLRQHRFDVKDYLNESVGWLGDKQLYTIARYRPKTAEVVCGTIYEYYQGVKGQYVFDVAHFDYGTFGWGKYPGYISQIDVYDRSSGNSVFICSLIVSDSESELDGFYFDNSDEQITIPGPGVYVTSPWGDYVPEDWLNSLERGEIYWIVEWLSE